MRPRGGPTKGTDQLPPSPGCRFVLFGQVPFARRGAQLSTLKEKKWGPGGGWDGGQGSWGTEGPAGQWPDGKSKDSRRMGVGDGEREGELRVDFEWRPL